MIHLHRVLNFPLRSLDAVDTVDKNCNVNYFEGDVRCTGDGVLVMAHDPDWEGLPIDQSTYCLLNHFRPLPKLFDVLNTMKHSSIGVNLEIKTNGNHFAHYRSYFILHLIRLLDQYTYFQSHNGVDCPPPIIQCFDVDTLKSVSHFLSFFNFRVELSWLIESPVEYVQSLIDPEQICFCITYISPYFELIQYNDIQRFHELGFKVLPWTLPDLFSVLSNPVLINADGWIIDYVC